MQGLTVTGMEIGGITTIAALIFPYVKRSKGIWDSSRYQTWKFLGIPLVTWGGLASLVYLGILFYFLIFTSEMRAAPARRTWSAGPIAGRRGCAVVLRLNGRNMLHDATSAGSPSDAERCRIRHRAKFVDYRILPRAPGS